MLHRLSAHYSTLLKFESHNYPHIGRRRRPILDGPRRKIREAISNALSDQLFPGA
ncbi:MAG: hypothetical protein WDO24_07900 [Pseudomonadota bacterium]